MRVFLDTNVLVAALVSRGLCAELLATVIQAHEWLVTQKIVGELERVFLEKFPAYQSALRSFLQVVELEAERLAEGSTARDLPPVDPDDVPHLLAAAAGEADLFVTGDRELVDLGAFGELRILSPREAWALLR